MKYYSETQIKRTMVIGAAVIALLAILGGLVYGFGYYKTTSESYEKELVSTMEQVAYYKNAYEACVEELAIANTREESWREDYFENLDSVKEYREFMKEYNTKNKELAY